MGKGIIIYGLIDPRDNQIKYIGKSTNPKKRLSRHIRESVSNQSTKKEKWINKLYKLGLKPILVELKKLGQNDNWELWEKFFIKRIPDLKNGTPGGECGGYNHGHKWSKELRKKFEGIIKERKRLGLTKLSEEHKNKLRGKRPQSSGKNHPRSKPFKAYNETEELVFNSRGEAVNYFKSKGLKASAINIGQCLNHKLTHSGKYQRRMVAGFNFKYL